MNQRDEYFELLKRGLSVIPQIPRFWWNVIHGRDPFAKPPPKPPKLPRAIAREKGTR